MPSWCAFVPQLAARSVGPNEDEEPEVRSADSGRLGGTRPPPLAARRSSGLAWERLRLAEGLTVAFPGCEVAVGKTVIELPTGISGARRLVRCAVSGPQADPHQRPDRTPLCINGHVAGPRTYVRELVRAVEADADQLATANLGELSAREVRGATPHHLHRLCGRTLRRRCTSAVTAVMSGGTAGPGICVTATRRSSSVNSPGGPRAG
jgi:hypothetical protein